MKTSALIDHSLEKVFVTNGHKRFRLIAEYAGEYWVQALTKSGYAHADGLLTFKKEHLEITL